jgi:hypothetical protein
MVSATTCEKTVRESRIVTPATKGRKRAIGLTDWAQGLLARLAIDGMDGFSE